MDLMSKKIDYNVLKINTKRGKKIELKRKNVELKIIMIINNDSE